MSHEETFAAMVAVTQRAEAAAAEISTFTNTRLRALYSAVPPSMLEKIADLAYAGLLAIAEVHGVTLNQLVAEAEGRHEGSNFNGASATAIDRIAG